ncbi:MAG: alpha/beta hydrolase [Caldilineae bacterium]|nr:MAG: alpha/beta hydrolase [Caldilineae bacterium]
MAFSFTVPEWIAGRFIYFPLPWHQDRPERYGLVYDEVTLTTADGVRLHGWWFPAREPLARLLFCHGNAGNISHRLANIAGLVAVGFSVFIFDYRGYGRSKGRPTEAGLYADARAAWAHLSTLSPAGGAPRLLFGRSLGGAVAIGLAASLPADDAPDGLIVESTFTSLGAMARQVFRLKGLERAVPGYPSLARLARIRLPLLVVHGTADTLIPPEHGHRLYRAAHPPKWFFPVPGAGHDDTFVVGGQTYYRRLAQFARDCRAAN